MKECAEKQSIPSNHIQPGRPQQNAYVPRSNHTFRHEWLALQLRIFTSSESIGLHDSEVMDDGCIDRDNVGTLGIVAARR